MSLLNNLPTRMRTLTRATANLPQTGDEALFRITAGKIVVLGIIGEVTTVVQTQANNTKLKFNPSGGETDADLCGVLNITAAPVGAIFTTLGDITTALKQTNNWLSLAATGIAWPGLILAPGDIELDCAASNTGQVKWTLWYIPLDNDDSVFVEVVDPS